MAKSNAEKCKEYRKRKKMEAEKNKLNNIVDPTLNGNLTLIKFMLNGNSLRTVLRVHPCKVICLVFPESQKQQNTKNISKENSSTPSTSTGKINLKT